MRSCAWLICLAACGRIGFDPGSSQPDAPYDPAVLGVPLVVPDPATLLLPFGAPTVVSVSDAGFEDDDPCLTRDQLEIFFDSARTSGNALFTARRASVTSPWSVPEPMTALNFDSAEHPHVSVDGLRLYFTSGLNANADLWIASRPDRDTPFGNPMPIPNVNSSDEEAMGAVDAAELVMVFSSARGSVNIDNLWESRRASTSSPWGTPVALTELNTATYDRSPHLDDYGRVIYFEREADAEIRWTQRASLGSAWDMATTLVTELDNLGGETSDPWLTPDMRTIYFALDFGAGDKQIYTATR